MATETITETITTGLNGDKPKRQIRIPDMFASFLSVEPRSNPHYDKVKTEADAWIERVLRMNEKQKRRFTKADFNWLVSLWVPDADEESLRAFMDWDNWIFFYDDRKLMPFPEEVYSMLAAHWKQNNRLHEICVLPVRNDPEAAQAECDATFALMNDDHPIVSAEENGLRHAFQYIWHCFRKRASPDLQDRYKKSMKGYFDSVVSQVNAVSGSRTLDIEEFMDNRRSSIGVYPTQDWIEWCYGIKLPQYVFENKSVLALRRISTDATVLANEVLSYRKDLAEGCEHNIIFIFRRKGLSEQQAVDAIGDMYKQLYRDWYRALAEMPVWGEKVDREILKYIGSLRDVPLGNSYWSFRSGRYLKEDKETVRRTRIITLS